MSPEQPYEKKQRRKSKVATLQVVGDTNLAYEGPLIALEFGFEWKQKYLE